MRTEGKVGIMVSGSFGNSSAVIALVAIPGPVIWSYLVGGAVLAIGLITIFLRGDWQKARGFDKLLLFGPLFFAAPIAAFGTEHFIVTKTIASLIPAWIRWHQFWVYFVGGCFIAAALSIATNLQARLSSSLLALTFFLFVILIHAPNWAQNPRNRFLLAVALRAISFGGGALALAASLTGPWRERTTRILAAIARYFVAIPVRFFSFEQIHARQLRSRNSAEAGDSRVGLWTRHLDLPGGRDLRSRGNPVACRQENPPGCDMAGLDCALPGAGGLRADRVVDRASLIGINFAGDTLMFCGAVLLLAGAMPREA